LGGTSVRLPEGPRNSKQSLGKLNLSSKKFIINDNYNIWSLKNDFTDDKVYDWLDKNGFKDFKIQLKTDKTDDNYINEKNNHNFIDNTIKIDKIDENIFSIRDCISATDKNIGLSHFLNFISESIGLTEILKVTFPDKWYQILVLAHFKVASQYPDLYCNFFIENNDYNISFKQLKSQRISDLYKKITFNEVTNFYYRWSNYIKEKEYLACDITSISTYSENLSYGALGYNRDGDKLKQINICLLFGETSGLPVFATKYHGSLNDVRTFVSTASQFNLLRNNNFKLIMDKGFYSKQNINYMLSRDHKIPFLISVPLTVDYLKK
jgi:hypothetical protein